ncbi:MAG: type VI secretion system tip protein TssI/VgrG [Salinibacter sp.]|uniref:type VI secretion system tip protein TssI/VgrG n=1 Tax=Salinibacter sp. TaxID=2065818 RepID=UPI0035D4C71B
MSTLKDRAANTSLYFFEPAELDSNTLRVVRFEGTEGISQPFNFELQLISEDPDLDFEKVVNKSATFTMMRGDEPRPVSGIVTDFSIRGRTSDYVVYQATLRPRLHWLSLSYRSRIFQEKKVEGILRTVLKEDGLSSGDFKFKLQESYSPREYCVQHEETDLNFVSRLMEFEGMYYFFEHGDGQDTLVVTDKKSEHEKIPDPASLQFHQGAGGMVKKKQETVSRFVCEEQVVTGKVELKNYNYRGPRTMTVDSEMNSDMPGKRYEYGENFRDTERGNRLAKVRNEEIEAQRKVLDGESDSLGLRSGFLFTLEKHYRKSLNADYLITQIEHQGSQRHGMDIDTIRSSEDKDESEPTYQNRFTCIPATVQYRAPRKTPKPEVPGVMTAEVDGSGDYAYLDDQGRYRAKMHFDQRDKSPGTATHPIRMKQPHSGKGEAGFHKPSHPGTEMIFACENGDPDRPMALGTAPNPNNESPVDNENSSQHIFRTTTDNELVVEDQEGKMGINLFTPETKSRIHMGSQDESTEGIQSSTEKTQTIHADEGVFINAVKTGLGKAITAKDHIADYKTYIDSVIGSVVGVLTSSSSIMGVAELVDGALSTITGTGIGLEWPGIYMQSDAGVMMHTQSGISGYAGTGGVSFHTATGIDLIAASTGVNMLTGAGGVDIGAGKGDVKLKAKKNNIVAEADNGEIDTHADENITVKSDEGSIYILTDGTGKKGKIDMAAREINQKSEETINMYADKGINLKDGKEIKIKCGQSSITLKRSGKIEIKGMDIQIKGTKSVNMKGMNISSKANVKNDVKGTMINSKAKGINTIKGSLTKIG